jgi:hypothetical protein
MNRTSSLRQLASGTVVAGITAAAIGLAGVGSASAAVTAHGTARLPIPAHAVTKVSRSVPKAPRLVQNLRCAEDGHMRAVAVYCSSQR